ncbi:MAG: hypothetical protein C5B50_13570 [Verrucomicrobia bacterium]|nr:MAG: hypothetical protein C5B50_13570 [Verrucomicrobiota bacterium]
MGVSAMALFDTGCSTDRRLVDFWTPQDREAEDLFYWGRATFLTGNTTYGTLPAGECCKIASNPSKSLGARRFAAALLFAFYVRAGFNVADMRKIMLHKEWLDDCAIRPVVIITGDNPWRLRGWHFKMRFFPDKAGDSDWNMSFTLAGKSMDPRKGITETDAKNFFKGDHSGENLMITEFVLYYPLPTPRSGLVAERHSTKGVGIQVRPWGWFELQ